MDKKDNQGFWFFTFGVSHPFHDFVIRIYGDTASTRDKMISFFGDKWAFQYSEEDFKKTRMINYTVKWV
jgi:hypothetical protein